jgi:SIR2-like domain
MLQIQTLKFMSAFDRQSNTFRELVRKIDQKRCVPFLGAGAGHPWLHLGSTIAQEWAKMFDYPMENSTNLSQVSQFLAIENEDPNMPKYLLSDDLSKIHPPDFSLPDYHNTLYAVLADLELPIYITTNYDHFIEAALESRGKQPTSDFCRWNEDLIKYANENEINSIIYKVNTDYKPTRSEPLVYHLHGDMDHPRSMVLTEMDYITFINSMIEVGLKDMMPMMIRKYLATSLLLFIGYSLTDTDFLVLFNSYFKGMWGYRRLAVLPPPGEGLGTDSGSKERALKYFERYKRTMAGANDMYWGTGQAFAVELRSYWEEFRAAREKDSREW